MSTARQYRQCIAPHDTLTAGRLDREGMVELLERNGTYVCTNRRSRPAVVILSVVCREPSHAQSTDLYRC